MEKALSKCIDNVLEDDSIEALYIYGSYVNGFYKKDSDIDIVALSSINSKENFAKFEKTAKFYRKSPLKNSLDSDNLVNYSKFSKEKSINHQPNISLHLIHPSTFQLYNLGHIYSHLKMVPVYNEKKCQEISNRMKSELVRRELVRFKSAGILEFNVLDPLFNYLYGHGVLRPWRIKKINRIFASENSQKILGEEYKKVLNLLEEKGMVEQNGDKFCINPNYVFNTEFEPLKDSLLFKIKNSYCGWHYLKNSLSMIDFSRKRK